MHERFHREDAMAGMRVYDLKHSNGFDMRCREILLKIKHTLFLIGILFIADHNFAMRLSTQVKASKE